MLSTLYIQLPARTALSGATALSTASLQFALFNEQHRMMQQGVSTLPDLRQLANSVKRLVLLLAVSDSRIMSVAVPKMAANKLKLALPNLLEQQLLSDTTELAIQALAEHEGVWQVAAIERQWLQHLAELFKDWPNRQILAFPRQLMQAENASQSQARIWLNASENRAQLQVHEPDQPDWGMQAEYSNWSDLLQQVANLFADKLPAIYLDAKQLASLRADAQAQEMIAQSNLKWDFHESNWITAVNEKNLLATDLFQALGKSIKPGMDFKRWRWPLGLLLASALLHIVAINGEWWVQKREAKKIEAAMQEAFKQAFPKEPVIRDPILQAQQKLNSVRRKAGQFAANDFLPLAIQFSEVWESLVPGRSGSVQVLDYKERQLIVKVRSSDMPDFTALQTALQAKGLQAQNSGDGVVQISVGGKR